MSERDLATDEETESCWTNTYLSLMRLSMKRTIHPRTNEFLDVMFRYAMLCYATLAKPIHTYANCNLL